MTARDAKQAALSVSEGKSKVQMDKVRLNIETACRNGSTSCTVYESLLPGVLQTLKSEGYTVTPFEDTSYRNESSATIDWSNV